MAIHRGPKIVTDGLVMNLDSASPKSYDPSQTGTAWYIAPVPGQAAGTIAEGQTMVGNYFKGGSSTDFTYNIYTWKDTIYGRSYNSSPLMLTINDGSFIDDYYSIKIEITPDPNVDGYLFEVDTDYSWGGSFPALFEFTYSEILDLFSFEGAYRFYIDGGAIYGNASSFIKFYQSSTPLPSTAAIPQKNQFEFKDLTSRNNAIPAVTTYSSSNFGVLNFNSTNFSRATVTGSPDFNYGSGDFTWEVWVKPTADGYLLDHAPVNNGTMQIFAGILRYYNPIVGIFSPLYSGGPAITANTWYNIVASRISDTTSLYLNGNFKVSGSDPCVYGQASYLSLGSPANFLSGYFLNAQMPVSRIYKGKGLTSSEVSQNYNALKGRFGIL